MTLRSGAVSHLDYPDEFSTNSFRGSADRWIGGGRRSEWPPRKVQGPVLFNHAHKFRIDHNVSRSFRRDFKSWVIAIEWLQLDGCVLPVAVNDAFL